MVKCQAFLRSSAHPEDIRDPTDGRNINDSDADLYAEFHEPTAFNKPKESSPAPIMSDLLMGQRSPTFKGHRRSKSDLSDQVPDLTSSINTDFSTLEPSKTLSPSSGEPSGYDFSGFDEFYVQHQRTKEEEAEYEQRCRQEMMSSQEQPIKTPKTDDFQTQLMQASYDGMSIHIDLSNKDEELFRKLNVLLNI